MARTGSEAVVLTQRLRPDLIMMDVRMPKMTGVELLREVKQRQPEAVGRATLVGQIGVARQEIGNVIKVIREITEKTNTKIDINDDGTIKIASSNGDAIKKAYDMIYSIVAEPEEGGIYKGTVVKIVDFGAFVNFFGAKDGLVHISQLASARVQKTSDVVKEGDKVKVKLLGFDERGKVLSHRYL